MNNIIPFDFNSCEIRVIQDDNNEPWFVAKDVAEILEYSDAQAMTRKLDDDEIQNRQIVGFGNRGINLINESGLYAVILSSQKPEAKKFKRWVTHDVLPSIRKTGSYQQPQTFAQALRLAADLEEQKEIALLERDEAIRTKAEIGNKREATAMNTASVAVRKAYNLEIELDQAQQYCTLKRMQMIHHGQKFDWRLLKSTSIEMELPTKDVFDANYGTVKAYHVDVWLEVYAITIRGELA